MVACIREFCPGINGTSSDNSGQVCVVPSEVSRLTCSSPSLLPTQAHTAVLKRSSPNSRLSHAGAGASAPGKLSPARGCPFIDGSIPYQTVNRNHIARCVQFVLVTHGSACRLDCHHGLSLALSHSAFARPASPMPTLTSDTNTSPSASRIDTTGAWVLARRMGVWSWSWYCAQARQRVARCPPPGAANPSSTDCYSRHGGLRAHAQSARPLAGWGCVWPRWLP